MVCLKEPQGITEAGVYRMPFLSSSQQR